MATELPKPDSKVCSHCGKPKPNLTPFGKLKFCQECIDKTMGLNSEDKL